MRVTTSEIDQSSETRSYHKRQYSDVTGSLFFNLKEVKNTRCLVK